jgi:hypothetical protein
MMATESVVTEIRIGYKPRPLQRVLHRQLEAMRFGVAVCHRRFGKTVLAVNHLQKAALTCAKPRPRVAYIGPTYRQSKAVAWDFVQHYSRAVPGIALNQSELRADYPNEGRLTLYGADTPDSLRGLYLDGCVLDEFGLMPPQVFSEVIRPALADRGGWCLFIGTPNGKNQFYDIAQQAKSGAADWFFAEYKASQTGILTPAELTAARSVMTQDEYDQEFECSFEAAVKGAIYSAELQRARADGRVTAVPYDPVLPVDTDWDLGVGDSTAIWFTQSLKSGEIRVIDYYESSGEGLPHYAQVLAARGYTYGKHWAPHDIQVRELGSGRSRLETAATLGIRFQITPMIPVEDGIHAARMLFPRCWFDERKCRAGLEALQHYRRDYNSRLNEFKATPVHDFASHGADGWRGLAVRHQTPKDVRRSVGVAPSGPHAWMG